MKPKARIEEMGILSSDFLAGYKGRSPWLVYVISIWVRLF
jgi:hypothetical protein